MTHSGQGDDRLPAARPAQEGVVLPPEAAGPWAPRGADGGPAPADGQPWGPRQPAGYYPDQRPEHLPDASQGQFGGARAPEQDDWYGVRSQPLPAAQQPQRQPYAGDSDTTRYLPPVAPDPGMSDATQVIPPVGPGPMDATQVFPPVGAGPLPPQQPYPGAPDATPYPPHMAPGPGMSDATQVIPPVGPAPMDATQVIPPVGPEPVDATQVIPPVPPAVPGALPPESPAESPAESTAYLGAGPRGNGPAVPPPPPGAPYGIRPGAPGDRPPPAEFDNLFRGAGGPGAPGGQPPAARPPYAAPQPPQWHQPAPQPPQPASHRAEGEGSRRRAQRQDPARRRKSAGAPVIAAVVVGCAVLGLGVGALMFGGEDEKKKDPGAGANAAAASPAPSDAASPSASPEPPAVDPVKTQAQALDRLLADSNDSRAAVIRSVANIRQCKNLGQAAADLRGAAEQRRGLVTRLGGIDIGKLPEHEDLAESLTEAWQASAAADDHYAAWADQVGGKKGCKDGKARNTKRAAQGNSASGEATEAKQEAAGLWNPVAARYDLPKRGSHQL
ncbi:hypothetical protein [Streptomyces sp. NPDC020141]|uniref:hypothetical protein n=1 Tax=Streptomyces sp. NPDC020141 TaxID=3365065 RepID=UPI0037A3758E